MSAPIHWKGTDYDSVEAMPPNIRAAYEQSQRDKAHNQQDQEQAQQGAKHDQQPARPAWGGTVTVSVPAGFESVTGLGPVKAVHKFTGVRLWPNVGTPMPDLLVRYRDGLAFRAGLAGRDLHAWRWEEVAAIQSDLHSWTDRTGSYVDREFTLTKISGEKVMLGDGLENVGEGASAIKHAVFALMGPVLAQRYQAGEALTFGPVTIDRQNGLQLEGKLFAWNAIGDIQVKAGRLQVTLSDGTKHEARVSAIPNIEMLCQVIGANLNSAEMIYPRRSG